MPHRSRSRAPRVSRPARILLAVLALPATAAAQASGSRPSTVVSAPERGAPHRTPDESAVEAALRALFAAAERQDLGALDTLYAGDSLTVVEGTGINRGWVDYRDHHLAPELAEMRGFRYRPFAIEPRVHGDLAWVLFRYALQGEAQGQAIDNVGRGTAILERRAGRWIVRHTQTTSRARRPGDPPLPQ